MIKLSKDSSWFWRLFGIGFLVTHIFFIIFVVTINFWPVYLIYIFFALMHFGVAKVWRYLLIVDVFVTTDRQTLSFRYKEKVTEIGLDEISKYKTYFGITDIFTSDKGLNKKFYFMPNSKENLKFLDKKS